MTAVVLRLERIALQDVDRHIAEIGALRLVRTDAGLWMEIAADTMPRAVAMLGRAGLRAVLIDVTLPTTRGLVPGIVTHLEPLGASRVIDTLMLRSLDEGEATARLARRSLFRRQPHRDRIGGILRGSDRAFVWRRAVYAAPKTIRALRGVRPIVFDRGALERAEEQLAFAGLKALTGWMA